MNRILIAILEKQPPKKGWAGDILHTLLSILLIFNRLFENFMLHLSFLVLNRRDFHIACTGTLALQIYL